MKHKRIRVLSLCLGVLFTLICQADLSVDIGTRRELFVDHALIDHLDGKAELRMHSPMKREVAIKYDQPWEGGASGYSTIIQDGELYHMYYRGSGYHIDKKPLRMSHVEVVCYAESKDGIAWVKPNLGLFEWNGSSENNIIWFSGPESHNFAPFIDTNPDCKPDERFKAIGGTVTSKGLLTFKSADGIHWSKKSEGPVVTKGAFDSHNTCFWDAERKKYTMYVRHITESARAIGVSYSSDFSSWSDPVGIIYPGSPLQQMYTNQIGPYYRAEHILMGFPTRYVAKPLTEHNKQLDPVSLRAQLTEVGTRLGTDLTDSLFMTSRDGMSFQRWDEAFLRPGLQSEGRWIYGDNFQSYGLWETRSPSSGGPNEISMHFAEYSWIDSDHQARRYTIRLDGFVSLHAPLVGGEMTSKPLTFSGKQLAINYSTSAAGSVHVEIQDADGTPLPGFALSDCLEHYGDSVEQVIAWKGGSDLSLLAGKPVRLRFVFKDADIYSFRFVE